MRYHLTTLGCPKNVTDSERLDRALVQAGHVRAETAAGADVLLVNSCGFIDAAKAESAQVTAALGRGKATRQQLIVLGCWSQIETEQIRDQIPAVDATFGIEAWDAVVAHLGQGDPLDIPETGRTRPRRASAYLKISDGCARPCTFCNIPGIKGRRFRSASLESLVEEAQRLQAEGVRELILVAQDSTAYGEEQGLRDGLAVLLERLAVAVPDVPWIRIMYAYPGMVSPRLVETMAALPQVCHYLDMPLQHGSHAVLRRMQRPHNMAMVHDTLERLRRAMPDIAIRTTFIVGFPGETPAEFKELLAFVRAAAFDRVGAFAYSPQRDTPAAAMPKHVSERVTQRRLKRLMKAAAAVSEQRNAALVGRELPVLVESVGGQTDAEGRPLFVGRSFRDAPEVDGLVFVHGLARAGTMPRVRVTGVMGHDLWAEPVAADVIPVFAG